MKNKREKESKEVRRIKQSYSNKKVGISLTALAAAVCYLSSDGEKRAG